MIIDTHCHYNLEPLSNDVSGHWKKAQENGVEKTIIVGADLKNSKVALEIANKFPNLYASIGIHPERFREIIKELLNGDKFSQDKINKQLENHLLKLKEILKKALKNKEKIVAIGEIGLDYYRLKLKGLKRELTITIQKKAFENQLKLAFKNNLVAIIHVRDQSDRNKNADNAYFDTLEILKKVLGEVSSSSTPQPTTPKFILHCASGPMSYIKEAISLGAYIGVAGNITYNNAQNLREIIKSVPPERLLLETDAPYLVPKFFQASQTQICEPHMIKATAKYLQEEMNINLDIIMDNTNNLFFNKKLLKQPCS